MYYNIIKNNNDLCKYQHNELNNKNINNIIIILVIIIILILIIIIIIMEWIVLEDYLIH